MKKITILTMVIVMVVGLIAWPLCLTGFAATGATVSLTSPTSTYVGGIFDVQVNLETDQIIEGIDLKIDFDPTVLTVIDADQTTGGVQISKGAFFDGLIARNEVDNQTGSIRFVTGKGDPGVSGTGVIANIKFKAVSKGTDTISISSAKLVDQTLNWVTCTTNGSTVSVSDEGNIHGKVTLQGRTNYGGITVLVKGTDYSTTTQDDGSYALTLPAGTYSIYASMSRYLSKKLGDITIVAGQTTSLTDAALLAGDSDNNDDVNLLDLVNLAKDYDKVGQYNSDFNNDQTVDLLDLVLLAKNYDKIGDLKAE